MLYFVNFKTNKVIRDNDGKVVYAESNKDPIISVVMKEHGACWMHYASNWWYAKPHSFDLSEK